MSFALALVSLTSIVAALVLSLIWGLTWAVSLAKKWRKRRLYLRTFQTLVHSVLSPDEEAIAVLHYGLSGRRLCTDEIAEQLGLSRDQVLRARTVTVWKLQEGFLERGLGRALTGWMPIVYGALDRRARS